MVEDPNVTCPNCKRGYKKTVYSSCPRCHSGPEYEIFVGHPPDAIEVTKPLGIKKKGRPKKSGPRGKKRLRRR